MIYKVGYIKDILGNNYLGIKFNESQISSLISDLKSILNDDELYDTMVSNQSNRDKTEFHSHHTTVVNVMEMKKLFKTIGSSFQERISIIQSLDITDLEYKGVGKAEKSGNTTYFVVIKSIILDEVRSSLGLDNRDLHITIGFNEKDVFGLPKNSVIIENNNLNS